MTPPDLRAALEGVYRRLKEALDARDYAATRGLLELDPDGPPLTRERWEEVAAELGDQLPTLDETRVVAARQAGDGAGLYLDLSPDDPDFADVLLVAFHRAGSGWKVSEETGGMSFPRAALRDAEGAIGREPALKLPGED